VPVPLKDNVRFATGAFDVINKLPLAAPVVCGAKLIPNVKLWPAASVNGSVRPLMVKADPVMFA
jgi:hypothetical protein